MANSEFEYTRRYEQADNIVPSTWIVIRIDGRGFHKLSSKYAFEKPNDKPALDLMNAAAEAVMDQLPDISLAYGQSDEYSFVFPPECELYDRRASKLSSTVVSLFTAAYVFHWPSYFRDRPLSVPLPSFDGRAVVYPRLEILRDYLNWRQADCHINNLYNTTFWTLVNRGGMSRPAAEKELSGTLSADKNEILFTRFGINYNQEDPMFRKGSILFRDYFMSEKSQRQQTNAMEGQEPSSTGGLEHVPYSDDVETNHECSSPHNVITNLPSAQTNNLFNGDELQAMSGSFVDKTFSSIQKSLTKLSDEGSPSRAVRAAVTHPSKLKSRMTISHVDIIGDSFWQQHPWILESGKTRRVKAQRFLNGNANSKNSS